MPCCLPCGKFWKTTRKPFYMVRISVEGWAAYFVKQLHWLHNLVMTVFSIPAIQEAYLIGSTAGMCAAGLKPIVEIQFGDYIFPGFNQLVTEIAKSCYLSAGKFPVQTLIRIPVGAYQGGGPYHSASIETTLLSVKGLKIVYPSNAADMKGLMKAAFLDPNPVIMLEHKGLYWSKVPGTEDAKSVEPSREYIIPLGKASVVLAASAEAVGRGEYRCVITYGMGVYWAMAAAKNLPGIIEIIDLRCLFPLDEELVFETVRRHGKCLVLTEEAQNNSFAEALAGRISKACFPFAGCCRGSNGSNECTRNADEYDAGKRSTS